MPLTPAEGTGLPSGSMVFKHCMHKMIWGLRQTCRFLFPCPGTLSVGDEAPAAPPVMSELGPLHLREVRKLCNRCSPLAIHPQALEEAVA